jgi:hypothetical protein
MPNQHDRPADSGEEVLHRFGVGVEVLQRIGDRASVVGLLVVCCFSSADVLIRLSRNDSLDVLTAENHPRGEHDASVTAWWNWMKPQLFESIWTGTSIARESVVGARGSPRKLVVVAIVPSWLSPDRRAPTSSPVALGW